MIGWNGIDPREWKDKHERSQVQGVHNQRMSVICQSPTPTKAESFWNFVAEDESVSTIVTVREGIEKQTVLNTKDADGHTVKKEINMDYWPTEKDKPKQFGSLEVALVDEEEIFYPLASNPKEKGVISKRKFKLSDENGEIKEVTPGACSAVELFRGTLRKRP